MTQQQVIAIIEAKLKCKATLTDNDTYMIDASNKTGYILFDIGYNKSSYIIKDKQDYFDNENVQQILELI